MNITHFLHNDNLKILWDVIVDEDIIKRQPREFQENIFHLFINNTKGFFEVESKNLASLVDMNKKYILLILNHANKSVQKTEKMEKMEKTEYKKIKIFDEIPKNGNNLITYEEIQNDRRSQFDKDLNKRQEEFTNAMTLPVPPVPKFNDNLDDGPISEMEKAIKEITAQRNYDVEQINRSNNTNLNNGVDNWLKSQETSVKNDKIVQPIQDNNVFNGNKIKHIKIDNNDIYDNNQNYIVNLDKKEFDNSPKKNVSWGKNEIFVKNERNEIKLELEEITKSDDNNDNHDIFKLFKRIPEVKQDIQKEKNKQSNEDKIAFLQNEVEKLNNKLDTILELLKK
jgi:hypothetical protein